MANLAIGIDLGGTRIKGVLIDADTGEVRRQQMAPTGDNWQEAIRLTVNELTTNVPGPIRGVGLAAPGLPDADNTHIAYMPGRLHGLEGFNWADWLGRPVRVINDAHAALLAEARFGAAQHTKTALMLTLGTGVGGGLLVNGQLHQGLFQMAGHLGHTVADADSDHLDITNMPGSLEDAIGNLSVGRRSYGRYHTTLDLVNAYRQGEPLATVVWLTSVRRLAVSIASLINAFSPERVVLGGGISQANEALFIPLRAFMDVFEWRPGGKQTPICKAYFDEWAGAIGAAAYVHTNLSLPQ